MTRTGEQPDDQSIGAAGADMETPRSILVLSEGDELVRPLLLGLVPALSGIQDHIRLDPLLLEHDAERVIQKGFDVIGLRGGELRLPVILQRAYPLQRQHDQPLLSLVDGHAVHVQAARCRETAQRVDRVGFRLRLERCLVGDRAGMMAGDRPQQDGHMLGLVRLGDLGQIALTELDCRPFRTPERPAVGAKVLQLPE